MIFSYLIFFGFMSSSKNSPFKGARSSDSLFGGHIKAPWGLLSFGNSQISNISWSLTSFHPSFGSLKRWVFGLGKEKYIFTFCIWHSYLLSEGFGILPKTQLLNLKTCLPLTPFFGLYADQWPYPSIYLPENPISGTWSPLTIWDSQYNTSALLLTTLRTCATPLRSLPCLSKSVCVKK